MTTRPASTLWSMEQLLEAIKHLAPADFLVIRDRTASGRTTVVTLHLNRTELVNLRRALRAIGVHPPATD